MKAWIRLIVLSNVRTYMTLLVVFIGAAFMLKYALAQANTLVDLPIAVQNNDQGTFANDYVQQLRDTSYVRVIDVPKDAAFLEDDISQQKAVAVLVIPKDYSERIAAGKTRKLLTLYVGNNVTGNIATEILSRIVYEQQMPALVTKHLNYADKRVSTEDVWKQYRDVFIEGKLTHKTFKGTTTTSLSYMLCLSVVLFLSIIQLWTNRPFSNHHTLTRAGHMSGFFIVYSVAHACMLTLGLAVIALVLQLSLTPLALLQTFVITILFELLVAALLYYVRTFSHQLFMAVILAAVFSLVQLGGIG